MSGGPWVGLSLMPTDDFRQAALPLFAEGLVEGLQWSFDTVEEIDWSIPLLEAYEEAGRLSGHGVHLGMLSGGWSGRQEEWLRQLKGHSTRRQYARISEHWGFTTAGDFHFGAPLPLPFTRSVLSLGKDRLGHFAKAAQVPIGLENLAFAFSGIDALMQGSFLDNLLRDIGGFVLLDVHNLYCQVENFGIDPVTLINSYPLDLVQEIHISGGSTSQLEGRREIRRDTHDSAVPDAVFDMAELALLRCPNVKAVILERLGDTIEGEQEEGQFREEFTRLLAMRDEVVGSEIAESVPPAAKESVPPAAKVFETPAEPETDIDLAAFQAQLLTTLYEHVHADEIMTRLRGADACSPFLSYLDTFDPAMVEVAALLTKKWARRDSSTH